jgi:hypothetical protein
MFLVMGANAGAAEAPPKNAEAERTLKLVQAWVHGSYDNQAQFQRDVAKAAPPTELHRLMHQFFAPVTVKVPGIPGYLVYQHASADGSFEPRSVFRVGLLQYITDPATGQLVQRELNFRDGEPWKNAWRQPERLAKATLADVNVNPGCDFYLQANAAGTQVTGKMKERACTMVSDALKTTLYAEDAVVIGPQEYRFWGRFVDDAGKVRWGTQSAELYQLVRVGEP